MDNYNQEQLGNRYLRGRLPDAFPSPVPQSSEMPRRIQIPVSNAREQEQKSVLPEASQPAVPAPQQTAEQEQIKPKQKRRSKNERDGRNYVCGCGKTYLSYPALYTHIKTKHDGQNPSGTQQLQAGRGRGRPRKVCI